MLALLTAAVLATTPCSAPTGTEALWLPEARFVVVGEMHGTTETPAAFAAMVCAAAEQGPVTVALELPQAMQPQLDAFLAAPDAEAAVATLNGTTFLNLKMADGRSSTAMLAMLEAVRELKAEGRDVAFHAFQPNRSRPRSLSQNYYELDMAVGLTDALHARPEARVLVLVGNIHARKTHLERFDLMPATALLPAKEVVSLFVVQQGGTAWNCGTDTCGANPMISTYDAAARGVILTPYGEGAFDGVLALGPVTASPPVAED